MTLVLNNMPFKADATLAYSLSKEAACSKSSGSSMTVSDALNDNKKDVGKNDSIRDYEKMILSQRDYKTRSTMLDELFRMFQENTDISIAEKIDRMNRAHDFHKATIF